MTPTLIGYFAKRTVGRPDWLRAPGVAEVCSVSCCVSEDPDGWIDHWRHNAMWVYDTRELAWSVVPETVRGEFDLYAYQMFPVEFVDGEQRPFAIPQLNVEPLPASFDRIGYDAVSRSCGNNFECSPLSCNHVAEHLPTNRYCLIDEADSAFRLAAQCEAGGCEPGPYFVVEVWRERREG